MINDTKNVYLLSLTRDDKNCKQFPARYRYLRKTKIQIAREKPKRKKDVFND